MPHIRNLHPLRQNCTEGFFVRINDKNEFKFNIILVQNREIRVLISKINTVVSIGKINIFVSLNEKNVTLFDIKPTRI